MDINEIEEELEILEFKVTNKNDNETRIFKSEFERGILQPDDIRNFISTYLNNYGWNNYTIDSVFLGLGVPEKMLY